MPEMWVWSGQGRVSRPPHPSVSPHSGSRCTLDPREGSQSTRREASMPDAGGCEQTAAGCAALGPSELEPVTKATVGVFLLPLRQDSGNSLGSLLGLGACHISSVVEQHRGHR